MSVYLHLSVLHPMIFLEHGHQKFAEQIDPTDQFLGSHNCMMLQVILVPLQIHHMYRPIFVLYSGSCPFRQ